jgi:hypothetical protein
MGQGIEHDPTEHGVEERAEQKERAVVGPGRRVEHGRFDAFAQGGQPVKVNQSEPREQAKPGGEGVLDGDGVEDPVREREEEQSGGEKKAGHSGNPMGGLHGKGTQGGRCAAVRPA